MLLAVEERVCAICPGTSGRHARITALAPARKYSRKLYQAAPAIRSNACTECAYMRVRWNHSWSHLLLPFPIEMIRQ